jgi:hypothetical protein
MPVKVGAPAGRRLSGTERGTATQQATGRAVGREREKAMILRQRRRPALAVGLIMLTLVLLVPGVQAQNYRFTLKENLVDLFIETDGTVRIVYDMTFAADPGSDPLDAVDIGMPNKTYRLSEVQASIDDQPLTDISDSPFVKPGVAVEFGPYAINPGETAAFHFEATVRDLIYQDSQDAAYASLEFAPTWFDSRFVTGTTFLQVRFHFPPGVLAEEPRYHEQEFTLAAFEDDRVVYTWIREDASGSRRYEYGASFPQAYLVEGVVQKAPAFSLDWSAICSSPVWGFLFIAVGWAFFAWLGNRTKRRRKMAYMPPTLAVEGSGIKRGLTAVEAAVLLEAPLNKVMTMILFGLVKKGVLTVESEKPLRVLPLGELSEGLKLWYYERRFLETIEADGSLHEKKLRQMVIDLIGDVNKKLTGFSRKETKTYYQDIAARAWKQVEAADTPEVLGERWGDGLEWTMLEADWDERTRRVFRDRPVTLPHWWWSYRPWVASSGTPSSRPAPAAAPRPAGGGTPVTLPTLPGATFAETVVGGIGNAANTVVGNIESFTGRVTQSTNPPPRSSSSSSRGGGYSCACACACAGCACACAGGGR